MGHPNDGDNSDLRINWHAALKRQTGNLNEFCQVNMANLKSHPTYDIVEKAKLWA